MIKIALCSEPIEYIIKKEKKKTNNCIFQIIGSNWDLMYLLKLKIDKNQCLTIAMILILLVERS